MFSISRRMVLFSLSICLVFVLCGCSASSVAPRELTGKMAPWTRFTMLDGTYRPLQEFRGKQMVLVFWSTWCHKSYRVLRKINAFANRVAGREAVFIAVSVDKVEKLEDVKDRIFYNKLDNFQHAFSGNDVADEAYLAFQGGNLPYIVVINPEGFVVATGNEDEPVYKAFGVDPKSVLEVKEP